MKIGYNFRMRLSISHRLFAPFFLVFLFAAAVPSHAESARTGYARANFKDLVQTYVSLGGADIMNPKVVDEYAEILHCDSYREKYTNDFEWNQVRQMIQGSLMQKKVFYRTLYEFGGPIFLNRYDFKSQSFPLAEESVQKNIGRMIMFYNQEFEPYCGRRRRPDNFPQHFALDIKTPLSMTNIYMSQEEADALVKRMNDSQNTDRKVYVRFRVKVLGSVGTEGGGQGYKVVLDGEIEDIDFFEDADYTIYLGKAR